jgi:hypothetical protein
MYCVRRLACLAALVAALTAVPAAAESCNDCVRSDPYSFSDCTPKEKAVDEPAPVAARGHWHPRLTTLTGET